MPGLMSNMFDPGEDAAQSNATTISGDGETGVAASPSATVEISSSHEDPDGSTSDWSNTTEVGTGVDLNIVAASATTLTEEMISDL